MKKFLLSTVSILSISLIAVAEGPQQGGGQMREQMRAKIQERVQAACGQDIATAGCSGVNGKARMQCMKDYKKSHQEFKVSEGCRAEMQDLREKGKQMREKMQARRQNQGASENSK